MGSRSSKRRVSTGLEAEGRRRARVYGHRGGSRLIGLVIVLLLAACAPLQKIPVEAGPGEVELFVDGARVAKTPDSTLELRADRSHVLMFRKPGYRPEQLVIESRRGPDGPQLTPARVEVELEPLVERQRKIEIELDPGDEEPAQ